MRSLRVPALVAGAALVVSAAAVGVVGSRVAEQRALQQDTLLESAAQQGTTLLTQTFERARTVDLMLARDSAFTSFAAAPGSRQQKVQDRKGAVRGVVEALKYLGTVFPGQLDSATYVAADGWEVARVAGGWVALPGDLRDVSREPYVAAANALGSGAVFRSEPYRSPYSGEWVVSHATRTAGAADQGGVVHFALTVDSLRTVLLAVATDDVVLRVVEPSSGHVVMDSRHVQATAADLGRSDDRVFSSAAGRLSGSAGRLTLGDQRMAYASVVNADVDGAAASGWRVVASAPSVGTVGGLDSLGPVALGLLLLGVALLGWGVLATVRLARERAEDRAQTAAERDRLAHRLDEMSQALTRVAQGDLGVRLPVEGFDDEAVAHLVVSFDETIERLRVLVSQAQDNGEQLARSAVELRAFAGQQADSAVQQSSAVTQTTATIQELAATASQIAESAAGVSDNAGRMLALTEDGRAAVQQSVAAMERIAERVGSITGSTVALGEKVQEIGGILTLLDDLSDQTNLLALNAAIEAARAGEQGRGFAVVAAEVRTLAERAQQSTARIKALVAEIHEHMRLTLAAGEEGAREVHGGSALAEDAVDALEMIASRVDDTATSVKEISVATQQQRSASEQVVDAMTRLSEVSRAYASGSRQAAASAEELASLAGVMQGSIETFRASRPSPSR